MQVDLSHPLIQAGAKQTVYLKVSLTGFPIERTEERTPLNLAIVLDRSGSMSGEKIEKARQAAMDAVRRLDSRDIVSLITYDHTITVDYPATRLTDRQPLLDAIARIEPGGNTALFGGVSKGAAEVRKFLDPAKVNRIILLSDGLANVGPATPGELGELGASLRKEGIAVSTIGMGNDFNSDLMVQLARRGGGNHDFVETAADLARIFRFEFGDALSVVAQEVAVTITCGEGFRPVRVLGRDADISGNRVICLLSQLYSLQEKYVLLEVETPALPAHTQRTVADVVVTYGNMVTKQTDRLAFNHKATAVDSIEAVSNHRQTAVLVEAIKQIGADQNERAIILRDQGKVDEARDALMANCSYLRENGHALGSDVLLQDADRNHTDAERLLEEDWGAQKKDMNYENYLKRTQQQR
jgi:Ca-activated chloride channel family protein